MKNVLPKTIALILTHFIIVGAFAQFNNAFRFKITGNGYSDETVIRLINGATPSFDGMYDAWKLISPNPNVPSIYTQIMPGQELSINSLPEFTEDQSITIYTNIPTNGIYTINFEEIYALSANYKISITNISSTTHYRILGDTALVFTFNAQQNSPSFTFNISTPLTTSYTDETCSAMNDGSVMVNNPGNTNWDIEISDNNNNVVLNNISNSSVNIFGNLPPGAYTAQVSSLGITDVFSFTINPAINLTAAFNLNADTVYLSEGGEIIITNTSQNAQNYTWDLGDGNTSTSTNPYHTYSSTGNYQISLTSTNTNCTAQTTKPITVLMSPSVVTTINEPHHESLKVSTLGNGNYLLSTTDFSKKRVEIYDLKGSIILRKTFNDNCSLSISNHPSGLYLLNLLTEDGQFLQEKIVR